MDTFYPIKHWLLTLLISPLILFLYSFLFLGGDSFSDFLGLYFVFILFGIVISLPALICYYFTFYLLKTKINSALQLKTILNVIAITGIFITFLIMEGSSIFDFILCYSIAVIICSGFSKIKKKESYSS